jgi:hypothetical protein
MRIFISFLLHNVVIHIVLQFSTIDFYRLSLHVYLFLINSGMVEIISISKDDVQIYMSRAMTYQHSAFATSIRAV